MINNFKSLFDTISADVGPALLGLMENLTPLIEGFSTMIGFLSEANLLFPMLAGYIAFTTTKMIANTAAQYLNAAASTANAAAKVTEAGANTAAAGAKTAAAIPVVGWVLGLAIIAAMGAAIWAFMSQTKSESNKVEDAFIPGMGTGGPVVSSPKGTFEGLPDDDVIMGTDLTSGGGGGGTNMAPVVSAVNALKTELSAIKRENRELRVEMKSYFGFGGSAIKGIGKQAGIGVASTLSGGK